MLPNCDLLKIINNYKGMLKLALKIMSATVREKMKRRRPRLKIRGAV
jgi:hypothetical protein